MRTKFLASLALTTVVAGLLSASVGTLPASAAVTTNATSAVSYAKAHGYRSSIGVLDTESGTFWGAGDFNSSYASESVMKVFIATRLLLTNQMSGWNETTAYKMITQSDDASANALYGRTGGDGVITWVKQALNIPSLGSPPLRSGWWGGTQINAHGMALFYNAVRARPAVWGWLGNAMHHASQYGSDGTYQFFGIPSATTGAAVKQGWGGDNAAGQPAFNSTGVVNGDRYAVVILTQGGVYGSPISNMVTTEARLLMPGGRIGNDNPDGSVDSILTYGNHATVRGWAYDPNAPSTAIRVSVYVNGALVVAGPTTLGRSDVNTSHGITGVHGFASPIALADGANSICTYAINVGAGTNTNLGCRTVTLSGSPLGTAAVSVRGNLVTVTGWAWDYDVPDDPIKVVVYVNGAPATGGLTTILSPAVNAAYHVSGTHAYSFSYRLPDGADSVCVYAINQQTGGNVQLACPQVRLSGSPIGSLDAVTIAGGQVTVAGWTYDYDVPDQPIRASLYLNGGLVGAGPTTVTRADVNTVYGLTGDHGYSYSTALVAGSNQLCMYGINVGTGLNTLLGCRTVAG